LYFVKLRQILIKFYALKKKLVEDEDFPTKELPFYFFVWSDDFPNIYFVKILEEGL
jgi:hypothetical protein